MQNKWIVVIVLIGIGLTSLGQSILIPNQISLPKDSLVKGLLISSLNGLLNQKERLASKNEFILKEKLLETSALMDELRGMEQNIILKDTAFYKCYLNNIVRLNDDTFLVQFCYMGIADGKPILNAAFKLLAKKEGSRFYFFSPLKENTTAWKSIIINQTTYHFKDTLNTTDVKEYQKTVNIYNGKLKASVTPNEFYYCDNFTEALQLIGVDYKLDYNGMKNNNLTSQENNMSLVLNGWKSRLRTVLSNEVINRPVDEGCAYLYGGSWGLTWTEEVLNGFLSYAAAHPAANWEALYKASENFANGDKPLKVTYAINALIVENIEKEKGFNAVMNLLGCGTRQKR